MQSIFISQKKFHFTLQYIPIVLIKKFNLPIFLFMHRSYTSRMLIKNCSEYIIKCAKHFADRLTKLSRFNAIYNVSRGTILVFS